jgi:hypothetical protein
MLGNVGIETVIGAIPVLGDLFDVVFKSNQRNLALLGDTLERGAPVRDPQGVVRLAFALIAVAVLAMFALSMFLTVAAYRALFG